MRSLVSPLVVVAALALPLLTAADLPVHCVYSQVRPTADGARAVPRRSRACAPARSSASGASSWVG